MFCGEGGLRRSSMGSGHPSSMTFKLRTFIMSAPPGAFIEASWKSLGHQDFLWLRGWTDWQGLSEDIPGCSLLHAFQPADFSVDDSETCGFHLLEGCGLTWGLEEVRRVLAKKNLDLAQVKNVSDKLGQAFPAMRSVHSSQSRTTRGKEGDEEGLQQTAVRVDL